MENLIPYLVPAVIVVIVVLLLLLGYVKAPPDMAYIISGVKKKSKVVIGKASIRIPFFERLDKLNLRLIPIDVKTSNAVPTADYININVDATVNVKISNDPEKLRLAAENFLNKNTEYIASVAREVLEGNVREIVGKMRLEEMVSDRQKFANLVKENAEPDLAAMGLDIISFNVQNFVDGNDVIENLGIDNIVKIKKSAAIAKAESERDIKVAQAAADKESNDAAVEAQTEIAKKQNELAIKKSELQMEADTKKAMADAAYEIQKEEQRKTIEVTTANADIAKQEREIELKQKQVAVTEQSLEAEVKKKAEAEKYAAQQRAEAELYQRQKDAEAKQFEAQREAEAQKAQAEAMRFAREQEAAGIRAVGEAEASAIQAKGIAEAEAMEKKAEAYAKYNKAAVAEMMIKVLPDIAGKVAEPLGQIDKITIIGGGEGGSNGVDQIAGNVPVVMAKVFESMKEATGIDLADIINAESYAGQKNSGPGGAGRHQPDGSAARLHHPPSGIPRLALCGPDQRHRRPHSVCRFLRLSAGGTAEGLPPSAGGRRFFDVEAAPGGGQLPGGACPLDGLEAGDAGPGDDSPDLGPGGSGPGSGAAAGPGPGPGRHPAAPAAGGGGTPAAG